MTIEERPTRYWGVIIFSLLWALVMIGFNSVDGSGQAGIAITVLWLWVAYYAFRGDVEGIRSLTKFVLILQVVVGIGIYFYLKDNDTAQAMFGMTPEVLLLSMVIPVCAWLGMFLWARMTLAKMLPEDIGKGDSAHPMESVASTDAKGSPQAVRLTSDDAVTATLPDPGKEPIAKENGRAGTNADAAPSNQIAPQYEKDPRSLTKDCESDQGAEVPIPVASDYVIAKTVIEYNEEARGYWEDLGRLPEEYQDRFLQMLDASPKGDPRQMYDDVCAAHEAKTRPYEDQEANDALEEMRSISTDAEAEFIRVYDLLGGRAIAFGSALWSRRFQAIENAA